MDKSRTSRKCAGLQRALKRRRRICTHLYIVLSFSLPVWESSLVVAWHQAGWSKSIYNGHTRLVAFRFAGTNRWKHGFSMSISWLLTECATIVSGRNRYLVWRNLLEANWEVWLSAISTSKLRLLRKSLWRADWWLTTKGSHLWKGTFAC